MGRRWNFSENNKFTLSNVSYWNTNQYCTCIYKSLSIWCMHILYTYIYCWHHIVSNSIQSYSNPAFFLVGLWMPFTKLFSHISSAALDLKALTEVVDLWTAAWVHSFSHSLSAYPVLTALWTIGFHICKLFKQAKRDMDLLQREREKIYPDCKLTVLQSLSLTCFSVHV